MMMQGPPPNLKKSGTFSARGSKGSRGGMPPPFMMMPPGPYGPPPGGPPPHLMPPPGHPLHYAHHQEEPIYMPQNTRPMSPMASYQPGHFPHEAYYSQQPPQQYATIDKANKYRKNHKGSKSSKANSKNVSSDSNADDSEFGAGIHKRGHINERAFSYSIRNEHRSRSYGSLANMQFGPNGEPVMMNGHGHGHGHGHGGGEDGLANMISEMDIGDDRLERSEVPLGMYPPPHAMQGGAPNWYGGHAGHAGALPPMMGPPHDMDPRILGANGTGKKKKKR